MKKCEIKLLIGTVLILFASCAQPTVSELKEEELDFDRYEVRFTNPECREYRYDDPVRSNDGDLLYAKPRNVFCTQRDGYQSGRRSGSPQAKLLEWISANDTREIWFHFLSFSNRTMTDALCDAARRGVKITFVLDSGTDLGRANRLLECRSSDGVRPTMHLRGRRGGLGYAHNKLLVVNPEEDQMKIAFTSANFSSGVVLHHENWHFLEISEDTYFARSHRCMHEGVLEYGNTRSDYSRFIDRCKSDIPFEEESNMKTFFIPGEGSRATRYLTNGIEDADEVFVAAHRFSYGRLVDALDSRLRGSVNMRMIVDDDVYWAGRGEQVGPNIRSEARRIDGLRRDGMSVRYMETNHDARLLHHNKFVIMNDRSGESAVFAGAGNLTNAGFNTNFENFYYIEVPHIVDAFNDQYDLMWNDLATEYGDMPVQNVMP